MVTAPTAVQRWMVMGMLKFILFAMIGEELNMDEEYWFVFYLYVSLWAIGNIMGWI